MNKPKWDRYVLDATLGVPFVFCPLDDDDNVVTGMNYIGYCPGPIVGVYHEDGPEEAAKFRETYRAEIDALKEGQ